VISLLRQDTGDQLLLVVVRDVSEASEGRHNTDVNADRLTVARGYTDLGRPVELVAEIRPIEHPGGIDPDRAARVSEWLEAVRVEQVLITYQRRGRAPRVDLLLEAFDEQMVTEDASAFQIRLTQPRFATQGTVSRSIGTAPEPSTAARDAAPEPEDLGSRTPGFVDDLWQRAQVGFLRSGAVQ
jgi:hypothetical protein